MNTGDTRTVVLEYFSLFHKKYDAGNEENQMFFFFFFLFFFVFCTPLQNLTFCF